MEKFKIDFTTTTLIITKAFAEKAENPNSEEYQLLMKFQADFPNLKIVRKTHKAPSKYHAKSGEVYNCNQYKNLSYKNMERFINALPEGESKEKVLESFNFIRNNAGGVQTSTYKLVRDWFVKQFPLYRKDPLFYIQNKLEVIDYKSFLEQEEKQIAQ